MTTHTVGPGECLASIAERFGFSDPLVIYNHPDNAALRRARPDPTVLLPGDEVVVPERTPRVESVATEQRHRFVVKRPVTLLRLRLQESNGKPRSGLPYTVTFRQTTLTGVTDAEGRIEQPVPRDLTIAVITIGRGANQETFQVGLGLIDPVTSDSGLRQRLKNLGLLSDMPGVDDATALRFALHTFQLGAGLPPTGAADDFTRRKLLAAHGS